VLYSSNFYRFLPVLIFLQRSFPYRLGIIVKVTENKNLKREHAVGGGFVAAKMKTFVGREVKKAALGKSMVFDSSCIVVAINE
jgi:hypothetical protein